MIPPAPPIQALYNAEGELVEEAGEIEKPAGMTLRKSDTGVPVLPPLKEPQKIETEDLRRASAIENGKDPDYKAPCGKSYPAGKRYLKQHTRHCKDEACVESFEGK